MKLNLFGKKAPTVAQVEAEQAKLAQRRADIQARQDAIHEQLVANYGTDADNEPLHTEADRLNRELRTLTDVSAELETQRREATKRELLASIRAEYEADAAKVRRILELNQEVIETEDRLKVLIAESNKLRGALLLHHGDAPQRLLEAAQRAGFTLAELDADLQALKAEFADTQDRSIARTVQQAIAIGRNFPSMTSPDSGLRKVQ